MKARWLRTAPFGVPVVPPVKKMAAGWIADEQRRDVEFHAGADEGHFRQGGRQVHRHVTGTGDGEEQLDGILAVAVEDGDVRALRKAEAFNDGAAARDALAEFLVRNRVREVGEGRHVGIGLLHPRDEFPHGRKIGQTLHLLAGDHVIEIIGHYMR